MPRAIIVGGGIAGLASGIAFANAGWEITVLERAPPHRTDGSRAH